MPDSPLDERGGRYTLLDELGEGGFGRVYVAFDRVLRREVALKELRGDFAHLAENRERLMREVQITGQLEHPGIVPVYDLLRGSGVGEPFYTMRLVRGQKLRDEIHAFHVRLRDGAVGSLELPRLLTALVGVCNAIGYAHSRGVMHRDLKPDNVVLGEFGEVVLLDWGLARVGDEPEDAAPRAPDDAVVRLPRGADAQQTAIGDAMGTPAYMAPEQARGKPGPRTDIYGLGAILFELLTGRPPHDGEDSGQVLQQILSGATPRARDVDPKVPAALDAICSRAMARDPAARYPSPAALADDLQRFLADEPVSVFAETPIARAMRWTRRHRAWTTAAIAITLVTVLVTAIAAVQLGRSSFHERRARADAERQREQGVMLAAKFAARTIASEIDLRWRVLEAEAEQAGLRDALGELAGVVDIRAHPAQQRLERWLAARHAEHLEAVRATSWFVTDAGGLHLGRYPADSRILGSDFSYRDYFHGRGRDLTTGDGELTPLEHVHRSVVFRSRASRRLIVAFSAPVWSGGEGAEREVLGVLAMTVELGTFAALQVDLSAEQTAVLVETDPYEIVDGDRAISSGGLILHHPRLDQGVFRLERGLVQRLRDLRIAERGGPGGRPSGGPGGGQRTNVVRDYLDPVDPPGSRPWLAAFEPVFVRGRTPAQRDTGWVVIVQDRAAAK